MLPWHSLTLLPAWSKIYINWQGGIECPSNKTTFGPKNDKTILPHIFEDLIKGLESMTPPLAPSKTYFLKIPENMLKFGNFQKSRFFGGSEGGNVISNPPKWFHISIFIVSRGLEAKNCRFSKILNSEKWDLLSFGGLWRAPHWKNFSKNGFKGSVTPIIKKSSPFESQKIAFKMIYRHFTLGGASDAPLPGIRLS